MAILRPVQQKFCLNFNTVNPYVFSEVEGGFESEKSVGLFFVVFVLLSGLQMQS